MSLLTDSLPSLYNGVSQQSPLVRSKDQFEAISNGWASLSEGLGKRPPTEHVAQLLSSAPSNALIHEINRDAVERYVVVAQSGSIRVFDLSGNEKTVSAPGGWGYLTGATDYTTDVAMFTVADYTFVVNRKKTVAMQSAGSDVSAQANYLAWINRINSYDLDGVSYGPGSSYQYKPNPTMGALTGSVQRFDKLPTTATEGAVYAVTGDNTNFFVTYYVRYTGGVWDECLKPGLINSLDPTTMPHCLVRQADGSFKFAPFSWMPRRVGDTVTNPDPPFVGRSIRKVLFYQNRLAVLSDENVILSVAGDFGNFYRTTVVDLLDSDPITVAPTSTKVSIMYDAVPFNDGIMLTSDQTQFSMTNGDLGLSQQSMAIRPVTSYEVSTKAGLVAINSDVYFAVERNGYAAVREYSRVANQDSTSASDISAHVPRYIPAGVKKIIPAGDINSLFVLTNGAPNKVYCYQFYWVSGTQKAQSAWHEWDMGTGCTVLSGAYLSGYLYLLIVRGTAVFLERINMQPGIVPSGFPIQVYLDRRITVTGSYNSSTGFTTFTLPYAPTQSDFRLVLSSSDPSRPGALLDPTSYVWGSSTSVSVPGNVTAGSLMAGSKYTFRIQFSQQFPRKGDGTAVTTGRLQLRTWTVSYRDTGYFHTEVAPYGALGSTVTGDIIPSKVKDFTGKTVGAADLILNQPVLHTGRFSFQVLGDASQATISISNDTHVAATFLAAEWEAFYFNRARV
jgi:hypothetical protein